MRPVLPRSRNAKPLCGSWCGSDHHLATGRIVTECTFCQIVNGQLPAAMVWEDKHTVAFVDLRQAQIGHTLVVPRQHCPDIRSLSPESGAHLMSTLIRVAKAVSEIYPGDGLSVWHSAGPGAHQEVPHLHMHVHPRTAGDGLLRIYPESPEEPRREVLEEIAQRIRSVI